MPDDDTMLGQNTIDFRNEGRREFQRTGGFDPEGYVYGDQQTALCSNDHKCQAEADMHNPGCPIEQQLRETFGF